MFDELIKYYLNEFQQKGIDFIKAIVNCEIPSKIILMKYKTIEPITEDQMDDLYNFAKELFPDGDEDKLLKTVFITHTIGTLL